MSAGSPILNTTDAPLRGCDLPPAVDAIGATVPPAPAEILLGAAMWLAAERDAPWMEALRTAAPKAAFLMCTTAEGTA